MSGLTGFLVSESFNSRHFQHFRLMRDAEFSALVLRTFHSFN